MADDDIPKIVRSDNLTEYTNKLKTKLRWSGTRAEYDLIATKDTYTTYYITDDKIMIRNDVEYGNSGEFLPLAGGTMDADATIKFQSTGVSVGMDDDTKLLTLCGSTGIGHGGQLMLYGKDAPYADTKGGFRMAAVGNDGSAPLLGMPDGTLTWGNTLKLTSGDNGLVAMTKNTNKLLLSGGDGISNGASIQLYGIDYGDSDAGAFQLTARSSMYSFNLVGKSDGTLKWNGKKILTEQSFYDLMYPIGITFVQRTASDNPNTLFPGTTWTDITSSVEGRYEKFDSSNVAGTQLGQTLPNISGKTGFSTYSFGAGYSVVPVLMEGAFWYTGTDDRLKIAAPADGTEVYPQSRLEFSANRSNGIYQDGANVQPYTVTVKLWQRTA